MPLEHGQRADGGGQVHLAPPVQRIAEQLAKDFLVKAQGGQEFSVTIDGTPYWVTVEPDHWSKP